MPLVIYTLHHGGPRPSIIASSILILLGNWIRYIGVRISHKGNFGVVMFGQILTGIAQPFVLSAPTRYSDLWFTGNGRVAATALMSLANPFGGALGQLIDPFWISGKDDVPSMVLYVATIVSILFHSISCYGNSQFHCHPIFSYISVIFFLLKNLQERIQTILNTQF